MSDFDKGGIVGDESPKFNNPNLRHRMFWSQEFIDKIKKSPHTSFIVDNPEIVSMINQVAELARKKARQMEQWAVIKREQNKINHNRERIRNLQHIFKECLRNEAFEKCAELEDTILELEIQNLISNSIIAY